VTWGNVLKILEIYFFIPNSLTVGKKTWINIYTKTVLPQSLQETFMSEDDGECGLNWGPELWNWQCKRPDSCVACQVPWNTTYTLKGICNSETE
jgi:hypothetical protein